MLFWHIHRTHGKFWNSLSPFENPNIHEFSWLTRQNWQCYRYNSLSGVSGYTWSFCINKKHLRWPKYMVRMSARRLFMGIICILMVENSGQIRTVLQGNMKYPILPAMSVSAEGIWLTALAHLLCLDYCQHNLCPGIQPNTDGKAASAQNKWHLSEADTGVFIFLRVCFSTEGRTCQTPFSYNRN